MVSEIEIFALMVKDRIMTYRKEEASLGQLNELDILYMNLIKKNPDYSYLGAEIEYLRGVAEDVAVI